jgi:putative nucleotidyltransferase with HDIG domain
VVLVVWVLIFIALYQELGRGMAEALAVFLLTGFLIGSFALYVRFEQPQLLKDEDAVALFGVLVAGGLWGLEFWLETAKHMRWMSPYGAPVATVPLLATVLLKPRLGAVAGMALAFLFGWVDGFSLVGPVVASFGGLAAVVRGGRARSRTDVLGTGLWIVAAQGVGVVILWILQDRPADWLSFHLRWVAAGGLGSALLALILLPPLESFFSRLTPIKLLELSDVNHPLLRRMSLEAPGTYHHSLIMASMAQAAAETVGADGLLCRVGAYFHDIGKMVKSEYFVENQGALGNPHEPLPPSLSRLVIQSHVKDGLALARQMGLDRPLMDFITMHHGTSRIEYFYRRAIEQSGDAEPVNEDEYRYPGPAPRTKETAIVMLADSIEASVRALDVHSHQRLADHVAKIIDAKREDGQLDDAPLTLADLHRVAASFVNTLVGIYHGRVKYPSSPEDDAERRETDRRPFRP